MTKIKSLLGIGVLFSASLLMSNPSQADVLLNVVNNVERADFKAVCMQGFSFGAASINGSPAGPQTYLIPQVPGPGAIFSTTNPGVLPIFNVTSTPSLPIATSNLNILGGRLYFWLSNSNTPCTAGEAILTISGSGGVGVVNADKYDQTSLPFQIVELSDLSGNGKVTIDLTYVDSFNLPVQLAVNQTNIPLAFPVGISNVATDSDKTLQAIINAYHTFMLNAYNPSGKNSSHYLDLVTINPNFPAGMGPILSPGSFLGLKLPGDSSPTIFMPNAASHLANEFTAPLNELFGKTIHIATKAGSNFIGEPIQNIIITGAPKGLSGYGFCLNIGAPSCNSQYQYYMLNPASLVVSFNPTDHSMLMGYVPGTDGNTSRTINFTKPLPHGTLTEGMWMQAPLGYWTALPPAPNLNPQIVNCLSGSSVVACNSSQITITGVTVSTAPNPTGGSNPFANGTAYQFMFSMIPWSSNGNFGTSFKTAGEQVFNGSGVFGGGAPAMWGGLTLQTNSDIGNLISTALNRGVTGTVCTSKCLANIDSTTWNTPQTNWYPKDTTLNQYASFWHNATITDVNNNIGELPSGANPSSGYAPTYMATGYGFAYDENPMGGVPNPGPVVPAEMNFYEAGGNTLTFTLGPLYGSHQGGNPGICGSANNVPSEQVPSVGLCSSGKQSTVTGGGSSPWSWTCNGTNGSTVNASCSAPVQSPPPPLLGCGTDQGGSFTNEPPASGLCLPSNIASLVSIDKALWVWSCTVPTVGTKSCNAKHLGKKQKPINFIGSLNLHANRGEFIKFTGGSGQGKVSNSVASSGKVYCSVQTINGAKWLRTQGGAGVCKLTITKAGDSTYQPTSVTKSIVVR